MENSFFILSKQNIEISRFHICTWDIEDTDPFIEIGVEFDFPNELKEIDFKLVIPSIKTNTNPVCLSQNLISNTENCKFIFNDNVKKFDYINNDKRNGGVVTFETRGSLTIYPIKPELSDRVVSFKIKRENLNILSTSYIRLKIEPQSLSIIKNGIANTTRIFDYKLNEKRNLPDNVYDIVKDSYYLCTVKSCFCLHVIPNSYIISFVDQIKLKNIRELEALPFKNYLPYELKNMKEGKYMILFCKEKDSDAYSFFTIFTKERIGTQQILLAIGANILCSLLFGFASLNANINGSNNIWEAVPLGYWIALIIIFILIIILFVPIRWNKNILKIFELLSETLSKSIFKI